MIFILISPHPGAPEGLLTFIFGPKMTKISTFAKNKGSMLNFRYQMHLINSIGRLYILYDFYVNFTASKCIKRPLDLHFGPKKDEISTFAKNKGSRFKF